MSDPASAGPSTDTPGSDRAIALRFNRFAGGFWRGPAARTAWTWTIALGLFLVLKLGVDIATNRWNRWFSTRSSDGMARQPCWLSWPFWA